MTNECVFDIGGVKIYATPWVFGTRAVKYFGSVSQVGWLSYKSDSVENVVQRILECSLMWLTYYASHLGATEIVGLEIWFDPFSVQGGEMGVSVTVTGTAATLQTI